MVFQWLEVQADPAVCPTHLSKLNINLSRSKKTPGANKFRVLIVACIQLVYLHSETERERERPEGEDFQAGTAGTLANGHTTRSNIQLSSDLTEKHTQSDKDGVTLK